MTCWSKNRTMRWTEPKNNLVSHQTTTQKVAVWNQPHVYRKNLKAQSQLKPQIKGNLGYEKRDMLCRFYSVIANRF